MRTPLLRAENKRVSLSDKCLFSCLLLLVVITALLSFLKDFNALSEVGVGAPPNWDPLVENFFALEVFTAKEHATPYEFKEDPEVGASYCDLDPATMACDLACEHILIGETQQASPYCYKPHEPYEKCWDTSKMRCWNVDGGLKIWDGVREFLVMKHWKMVALGSGKSMKCLHVRQEEEKKDIILFGWGFVRPVRQICNLLAGRADFLSSLWDIPTENTVLIGGHSEGSGWAMCLNEWAQNVGITNVRHVVTSGTLVPDAGFIHNMDTYSVENSLFLMHARKVEEGKVLPDVFPILHAIEGRTLPHFGYICSDDGPTCFGLMTPDLAKGFEESVQIKRAKKTPKEVTQITKDIHMFSAYRKCWRACRNEFPNLYGEDKVFNYQWNIPSFDVPEYPLPEPLMPIIPPQISPELVRPMLSPPDAAASPFLQRGGLIPPNAMPTTHVSPPRPPPQSQRGSAAGSTPIQPPAPPGILPKIPPVLAPGELLAPLPSLQRPPRAPPPPRSRPIATPRLAAPPDQVSPVHTSADVSRKRESKSKGKQKKRGGHAGEAGPSQISPPSVSGLSLDPSKQIRVFAQTQPLSLPAEISGPPLEVTPPNIAEPNESQDLPQQSSLLSPEAVPFEPSSQTLPEAESLQPASPSPSSPGSSSGITLSEDERKRRKDFRQRKGIPQNFLDDPSESSNQ